MEMALTAVTCVIPGIKIYDGKYSLEGLPAVYAQAEEAQTLEVYMEDPVTHVQAVPLYGVLPKLDIITRSVKLINGGGERVFVESAASAANGFYVWRLRAL